MYNPKADKNSNELFQYALLMELTDIYTLFSKECWDVNKPRNKGEEWLLFLRIVQLYRERMEEKLKSIHN
jgi:hypothetical protein